MRIGITGYPTYGGSGVVATELGQELAARGHDVHFLTSAPQIRMNPNDLRIHFHQAAVVSYPLLLPFITTLHGTDITLVGNNRSFLPITRYSIEQSDGVTSISRYLLDRTLKDLDIKRPIEVIPNFVNCDLYFRHPDPELRAEWAPNGEVILMHLSNFRPVKRILDAIEIFALVHEKMPAKLV